MRISTSQINNSAVNAILDQQTQVSKTQLQIASGKRVLKPSDDPAAAARILDYKQGVAINEQYLRNIDTAKVRLGNEETALSGVENLLQRVREIAVQGNNDTQSPDSRKDLAAEARQRLDELLALANTKDANGEYLFSGHQRLTQPFAPDPAGGFSFAGDQGQRFLQVGPDRQVADGDSGAAVFQLVRNGNGTFTTQDNAANSGSGVIDPGSVTDPSAYDGGTYDIVLAAQTDVAGGTPGFTDTGTDDALQYELRINGTVVYTANEGDSQNLAQLETDINAQEGTTGVHAYVDSGTLYLSNSAPGDQPITVTESLLGASEDTDGVTGFFGAELTGADSSRDVVFEGAATGFVVLDGTGGVQTSGAYAEQGTIAFDGVQTDIKGAPNIGDRFTVAPSTNQDIFTTLQNLVDALEAPPGGEADRAAFHNAVNRVLADLNLAQTHVTETRATVGTRLNAVDSELDTNQAATLKLKEALSNEEDLDYAEAAGRFNLQLVSLQAAQQAFVKLQGLSLFNFLR